MDYDEEDEDDDKLCPSDDYVNSKHKDLQDRSMDMYLDKDKNVNPEACYDMLARTLHDMCAMDVENCIGPLRMHLDKANLVSCVKPAV